MEPSICYFGGKFLPLREMAISPFDLGFLQGVTIAERMRTFRGELFRWDVHLQRLRRSLQIVGIPLALSDQQLTEIAEHLVKQHHSGGATERDVGLALFVTPGDGSLSEMEREPTVGLYTEPLNFALFARLYDKGQSLHVARIRQISPWNWPSELKCRSRMHYYLADREARQADPTARALLLDAEDYVTEASTANIVAYFEKDGCVSPPLEKILHGVSLQTLQELASQQGIAWTFRDLKVSELRAADELFLCSTSPCVVPVVNLNGQPIADGRPGKLCRMFLDKWSELVGVDIVAQAQFWASQI